MKKATMMMALAACLNSASALAQDTNKLYAGGSIGKTSAEWMDFGLPAGIIENRNDTRDIGFKLYGGYHFNDSVDFRAGYTQLGETSVGVKNPGGPEYLAFTNKSQALFFDVLTRFQPVDRLSLFAKLGLSLTKSDLGFETNTAVPPGAPATLDETDYAFAFAPGIGLSYDITPQLGITAEYEIYSNVGKTHTLDALGAPIAAAVPKNDITVYSLGAYYHF